MKVVPEYAAFGFAPGDYVNLCIDCPPGRNSLAFNALDTNQFYGAKFSTRCEQHAREAKERFHGSN